MATHDKTLPEPEILPPVKVDGRKRNGAVPGERRGGRVKGTPNNSPGTAQLIAGKAAPDAMRLVVACMRGERIPHNGKWFRPEPYQRIACALAILRKVVPDLKAVEVSGPQGEPVAININLGVALPPVNGSPSPTPSQLEHGAAE
jgi:hypothetical protein